MRSDGCGGSTAGAADAAGAADDDDDDDDGRWVTSGRAWCADPHALATMTTRTDTRDIGADYARRAAITIRRRGRNRPWR
jgi:hypothetical protein